MNILLHTLPILLVLAVQGSPTTKDEKPQVHLYYEPLCIDCRNYWEQEFYPFYQKYSKSGKVGFHINPYGNRSPNFPDPPCQHGQWECNAATLEVCTYFTLLGEHPDKIIPTIACLESHLMYPGENMEHLHQITEECYRDNKVESELSGVRKCLQDEDGNIKKFIEGLGEETNNLKPDSHKWVPWIVFNDESHTSIQEESGTGPCSAPCKGANYIGLEGAFCKHFPDSCIKD